MSQLIILNRPNSADWCSACSDRAGNHRLRRFRSLADQPLEAHAALRVRELGHQGLPKHSSDTRPAGVQLGQWPQSFGLQAHAVAMHPAVTQTLIYLGGVGSRIAGSGEDVGMPALDVLNQATLTHLKFTRGQIRNNECRANTTDQQSRTDLSRRQRNYPRCPLLRFPMSQLRPRCPNCLMPRLEMTRSLPAIQGDWLVIVWCLKLPLCVQARRSCARRLQNSRNIRVAVSRCPIRTQMIVQIILIGIGRLDQAVDELRIRHSIRRFYSVEGALAI